MTTKIIKCNCEHEYQDEKYGKYYRLHNETGGRDRSKKGWRCTVCGDEKKMTNQLDCKSRKIQPKMRKLNSRRNN